MNKKPPFQQKIKQILDRHGLSTDTRIALQAARNTALDDDSFSPVRKWIPATAICCLVLVIAGVLLYEPANDVKFPQAAVDDFAVIASEDELELFEELEFYVWFDQDEKV